MEAWKLQTLLNDFVTACETDDASAMIRNGKKLRTVMYERTTPDEAKDIIETLFPLLDDSHAHVRQIVACVLLDEGINENSPMPHKIPVLIPTSETSVYTKVWDRKVEPETHEREWQNFVTRYREERSQQR